MNSIRYDRFGRTSRVDYGNGTSTQMAFDATTQRLSQLNTTTALGLPLQQLRYTYNTEGIITGTTNEIAVGSPQNGPRSQTFTYDSLNQLTHSTGVYTDPSGNENRYTLKMNFDAVGNITKLDQKNTLVAAGGGGVTTIAATTRNWSYAYNAAHPHQAATIGPRTLGYDLNGNQTVSTDSQTGSERQMFWDEEDRLTQVKENGVSTYFMYDAGGTRTHKSGNSGATYYPSPYVTIRNGWNVSKHIFAGGTRVATVLAASSSSGGGSPQTYWYHSDQSGNVQYTTNQLGTQHEHLSQRRLRRAGGQ